MGAKGLKDCGSKDTDTYLFETTEVILLTYEITILFDSQVICSGVEKDCFSHGLSLDTKGVDYYQTKTLSVTPYVVVI